MHGVQFQQIVGIQKCPVTFKKYILPAVSQNERTLNREDTMSK